MRRQQPFVPEEVCRSLPFGSCLEVSHTDGVDMVAESVAGFAAGAAARHCRTHLGFGAEASLAKLILSFKSKQYFWLLELLLRFRLFIYLPPCSVVIKLLLDFHRT